MSSDYLDRSGTANKAMGAKAKAVRSEQRRVANIIANKVGEAVGFAVAGPKEAQQYQQLGVLGSKGFVKAAASLGEAVVERTGINAARIAMSGKAQNMPIVDVKTGTSPFLSEAIKAARKDLVATTGRGRTYTGMRSIAAHLGRKMERQHKYVEMNMDIFGPNHPRAIQAAKKWHVMRDYATSLKNEAKKALPTKRTAK